jgi:hypothetical protein
MADILRRFPDAAAACVDAVAALDEAQVGESEAREAYAWTLGEFGRSVQDAPYVLESMAEGYEKEAPGVRLVGFDKVSSPHVVFKRRMCYP